MVLFFKFSKTARSLYYKKERKSYAAWSKKTVRLGPGGFCFNVLLGDLKNSLAKSWCQTIFCQTNTVRKKAYEYSGVVYIKNGQPFDRESNTPYPDVLEPLVDVVGHDIHPEESVQEPELNDEAQDLAAHELRAWGVFKL